MAVFAGSVNVIRTVPPNTLYDPELVGTGIPSRVRLDGDTADIVAGGNGVDGDLRLRAGTNQVTVHLDGNSATLFIGGGGQGGDIFLFPAASNDINDVRQAKIHIDGQAGDIRLFNADLAEDFGIEVADSFAADPGTVMVLSEETGQLRISDRAYDRRVVGVVSGALGLAPAIILNHQREAIENRGSIALAGKTYCKVDASYAPLEIGDMLTTSATPGHAMSAVDSSRAFGAVVGKALASLSKGRALVPMLIALQ